MEKEKAWEVARHNEQSPAKGMAAVNTHLPEEKPIDEVIEERQQEEGSAKDEEQQG